MSPEQMRNERGMSRDGCEIKINKERRWRDSIQKSKILDRERERQRERESRGY